MTAPQAQSKLNEVYDFLISFEGMINPSNIKFSRWLKDARALRQSRPAEGFLMEALVYRAQGKLEQAVEYAEKSYRLDKSVSRNDYATILSNAGRFEEAISLALRNLKEDNFNDNALTRLIIDSPNTLDINALNEALSLFKDPNDQFVNLLSFAKKALKTIEVTNLILNETEITYDTYTKVNSIVSRAINTHHLGNSEADYYVQHNEVGKFLIIDHKIPNADIEDCFLIYDKYTDDLIDSELSFKDYKRIVYNFLPLESKELSKDNPVATEEVMG